MWEFLWYNCSAVCGSSAGQLYGGANVELLQEGLCHMLSDPGLLQPEPLSPQQATTDPCLHRRHSLKADLAQSLWGLWGLVHTRFWLSPRSMSGGLGFDSKCDFAPPTVLLGLLLCPWTWGIFFWWDPTFSWWWLLSRKLQFWSSHRRKWAQRCHLSSFGELISH